MSDILTDPFAGVTVPRISVSRAAGVQAGAVITYIIPTSYVIKSIS